MDTTPRGDHEAGLRDGLRKIGGYPGIGRYLWLNRHERTGRKKYVVTCLDFLFIKSVYERNRSVAWHGYTFGEGAEAYDSVRPLAYQDAQVFLLCFSIADPQSLDNARNKWYPEIRDNCGGNASVILCGCQTDLRTGGDRQAQATVLTPEQGVSLSRQVGATTYVETSSKTSIKAVKDAFEVAALAAMGRINKRATISRFSSTAVQQQQGGASANKNNKVDLRNEIKVRAKSCNLM
ncbi:hypothetical protein AAG570_006867 [Ranatra chinensis]|uniref:Uncharacterized protein n=1 Tax=Ranatra chinensis TaxID=642074 RepID=A0ABD0YVA0_9HEMI